MRAAIAATFQEAVEDSDNVSINPSQVRRLAEAKGRGRHRAL